MWRDPVMAVATIVGVLAIVAVLVMLGLGWSA